MAERNAADTERNKERVTNYIARKKVKVKVKQFRYRPGVALEGSRKLRFPDFVTTAQDGGKVVSLTHLLRIRRTPSQLHSLQQIPTQHDMLPQHLV